MPSMTVQTAATPVELSYSDDGDGAPVVLIHGFAATKEANWHNPGWVKALSEAGYRVIALDNRGHGKSTKFHRAQDYTLDLMAADTWGLIQSLGLDHPHVFGYSMGARIAAMLAIRHGGELGRIVLSGSGSSMVDGSGDWTPVSEALLAPSLDQVTGERGRTFRKFADQTGSDLKALAACVEGLRQLVSPEELASIGNDVLVATGTDDEVAGRGERLAELIPGSRFFAIRGRDHMRAVGDKTHIAAVLEFLSA